MGKFIGKFIRNEQGATAIEYGLIAALVALGITVGASALGTDMSGLFDSIGTKLSGYAPA